MTRFGRYELVRRLGGGGMGEVFLARDEQGKPVVIKRVLPHLASDAEFRALFFDEARTLARLDHPNIVHIFDLGEADGQPFLAMEYVRGVDLLTLSRHQWLPLEVSCRLIADAAGALDFVHHARDASGRALHLVHRDVSPHNLLIDVAGALKLIDFGLAGSSQGGRPGWMSPEQALEGHVDARSDQFSLGVVCWELLAGRSLFERETDVETLSALTAFASPPRLAPVVPVSVEAVVLRMLARDSAQRFEDLSLVRAALLSECPATVDVASFVRPLAPAELEAVAQPPRASKARVTLPLEPHEVAALAQLRTLTGEFSLEEAEQAVDLAAWPGAPWALDVVQALHDKGHLASRQREDGTLAFTA